MILKAVGDSGMLSRWHIRFGLYRGESLSFSRVIVLPFLKKYLPITNRLASGFMLGSMKLSFGLGKVVTAFRTSPVGEQKAPFLTSNLFPGQYLEQTAWNRQMGNGQCRILFGIVFGNRN